LQLFPLGAGKIGLSETSSRDPLYLCCQTMSAKDATPPGAKRQKKAFLQAVKKHSFAIYFLII
jgi:hypothetical protein